MQGKRMIMEEEERKMYEWEKVAVRNQEDVVALYDKEGVRNTNK